ncbi:DNA polymerase III subunit delta' [Paeniroseomonas aquatica]|uniref:DNA polymerase III subunit delta n=1 Tax=Paeniroseomonas aquatica TaxID=373043 RepID=A0ABT8A3J0_9PROT|nr:DNA polymerase III subunit delta' [Paeniroseomonas aquatica]MDN3564342.1 DNA polymerase III subunit delta' [Paeniroseomonas aquatica]
MTDPRANPELVGHDDAARTLEEAALSGRMHHAWLIAGPTGVGKATLAYRFARWLLAGMPPTPQGKTPLYLPEANATFRRVAAAAHADLFTLAPTVGKGGRKEVLRVDDARDALRFMALTAAEGGWRAVVVEDVEQSERELVQNILLKTLEEPPPRTVQLLVTSAPDRLLPTIRSRCRRLDLAPLSEPALTGLLTRWMPEMGGPDRLRLAHIADGCPGRALLLAEGEGLALQTMVEEVFAGLPRLDPRRIHDIADRVTTRRDAAALTTFLDLLRRALAAGLRAAARGTDPAPWIGGRSLAEWSTLWEKLGRLADETERLNLDRKQAVLSGLGMLSVR